MEKDLNKRKILAEQFGVNPDEYTLSDDGAIATPDNTSGGSSDKGSATQAAFTGARRSIGSTIGGLGATALMALATDGASLAVSLPAMFGAGLAGGAAGGKAQQVIEPKIRGESEEETNNRLLEEQKLQQEHPIASEVGEVAPNLLAFRPSPTALKNVFTGSGAMIKSLGSRALSGAQKGAMINAGINAGMGAAGSIAGDIQNGGDIDIVNAGKQALINAALFNEPWLAGRALGFHPSENLNIPKKTFTGSALDLTRGSANIGYTSEIGPVVPGADINSRLSGNSTLSSEAPVAKDTLLAQREVNSLNEEQRQKQVDYTKARLEQWQQKQKQVSSDTKQNLENPEPPTTYTGTDRKPLTENQLRITKPSVERGIEGNTQVARPEVRQGEGNINDFGMVKDASENEKQPLTEAEQLQDVFDRNYQKAKPEVDPIVVQKTQSIIDSIKDPENPIRKTYSAALEAYKLDPSKGLQLKLPKVNGKNVSGATRANVPSTTGGDIRKQPNVFLGLDSEPISAKSFSLPKPIVDLMLKEGLIDKTKANSLLTDDNGNAARGVSIGSTRETEINPTIATADTAAHEATHHYINELLADPKTAPYAKRLIEAAGGEGTIHPESTVEEVGKRVTDLLGSGKNTKFGETFLSNLKQRLGVANEGDVVKILTDHLVNNPSYEERSLGKKINFGGGGGNNNYQRNLQENTPEFKQWFGKSKVVDSEGKPLVVYHATSNGYDFDSFHPDSHFGTKEQAHDILKAKGEYLNGKPFDEKQKILNSGSDSIGIKDRIMPVYLNIKNPKRVNDVGSLWFTQVEKAKLEGYDGLVYKNIHEGTDGKDSYVAFYPEQIKSAIGNKGTFDPKDSRINFQKQVSSQMQEYYQKGIFEPPLSERIISPDDLVNHIQLGLPKDELHGGKSTLQRITDSLNPFNWTKSETQKIAELNTREGKELSKSFTELAAQNQLNQGKYRGVTDAWRGLNAQERDLLYRTLIAEQRNNKSLRDTLPANIQPNYDTYRDAILKKQQDQIKAGELVKDYRYNEKTKDWEPFFREAKINPFYAPNIISSDVFEILAHPGTEVYNKLHQDFIDHQKANYENLTDKQAEELFREFIEATGGVSKTGSVRFGANRYAEGIGLPDSWIEPDALDASRRYLKRVSLDRAFFDTIESKPEIARMAGINLNQIGEPNPTRFNDGSDTVIKDLSHNPNVRNVLDIVQGRVSQKNPTIDAASSLASSMLLGPVSAIRDFISVPFNIAKYSDFRSLPRVLTDSLTNFRAGYLHSFETGFNKHDPTLVHDLFNPTVKAANKLYETRNLLYKVSGRQSIYQLANGWAQSCGEAMMNIHITKAIAGDKRSIEFLQQLTGQDKFTPQDVEKLRNNVPELATRIGQYAMGTNDYRTLPLWAINSPIAPIFRLARWNIEMTNNFNNHVITPLKNGNPEPFILATMGSLLGGLMVKKLKELTYDKKSYLPTLDEMANSSRGLSGNAGNVAYYAMALASYSGYAGILSDFARSSMDMVHKNNPQSFNFPAWGLISDSTARVMDAVSAIANGESNFLDVAPKLIADEMKNNFQLARLANTWLFENTGLNKEGKQQRDTSEKLRDLRVFNQVEGNPTTSNTLSTSNPYEKTDVKRFKHETDLSQTPEELQSIVGRLIKQYGNNPEELKKQLRGVGANNYQTFPNPKQNPIAFGKYYQYLKQTIGDVEASKRLQDYLVQNKLNTSKSKMVPKLK